MRPYELQRSYDFDAVRLCVILETGRMSAKHSLALAEEVLGEGCKFVQIREKQMSDRDRLWLVQMAVKRARQCGAWVVANDRPDLAILAGANGVHVGQGDLAAADVQRLFACCGAENAMIGQSVRSRDEAIAAQSAGADYVGCGAVFQTSTKVGAVEVGLETLAIVAGSIDIPVFGVGGITVERVGDVMSAGAHGVAVSSAVLNALDPARATRDFLAAIDKTAVRA